MELVASALGAPSANPAGVYTPHSSAPPLNPKTGAMRHRLPDEGAAILMRFASAYGRGPTSSEAHELVAQIQCETAYETNLKSVKFWFYRRRIELNLEPLASKRPASRLRLSGKRPSRPSWKVSQINQGSVTVSTAAPTVGGRSRLPTGLPRGSTSRRNHISRQAATSVSEKPKIGGNRRPYPQEAIAILEAFALNYGRYPSTNEAKELVKRVRNVTGYQTTLNTVKLWFYKQRTQYNLQTLVEFRRAMQFEGPAASQAGRKSSGRTSERRLAITIPPRPSAPTRLFAAQSASTAAQPDATLPPVLNSSLPSLSQAHVAILRALQPCGDQTVGDPVISACAETWGVDKGLIDEWLRDNPISSPLTPISSLAFTPISFSIPLRPSRNQEHGPSPQLSFSLSDSSQPSGGDGQQINELGDVEAFEQLTNEWPLRSAETEGVVELGMPLPALASGRVIDPLVEAIIEVVRDTGVRDSLSTAKPSDATEFKALWPWSTCLGNLFDVMQVA